MSILDVDDLIYDKDNSILIHQWLKDNVTPECYGLLEIRNSIEIKDNIINIHNCHIKLNTNPRAGNLPDYIKFGKVDAGFDCSSRGMTSLKGTPDYVGGNFICSWNNLKNLKNGPKQVLSYYAQGCNLTTIFQSHNLPRSMECLSLSNNPKLKSISGLSQRLINSLYINECPLARGAKHIMGVSYIYSRDSDILNNEMNKLGISRMIF